MRYRKYEAGSKAKVTCPSCNSDAPLGSMARSSRAKNNTYKDCALCKGTKKVLLAVAVRFVAAMNGSDDLLSARPTRSIDPWAVR